MELADRGEAVRAQLAIDSRVLAPDLRDRDLPGDVHHHLAPGPEVAPSVAAPERPLEGMAVGVDKAGYLHPQRLSYSGS